MIGRSIPTLIPLTCQLHCLLSDITCVTEPNAGQSGIRIFTVYFFEAYRFLSIYVRGILPGNGCCSFPFLRGGVRVEVIILGLRVLVFTGSGLWAQVRFISASRDGVSSVAISFLSIIICPITPSAKDDGRLRYLKAVWKASPTKSVISRTVGASALSL